MTGRAPRSGDCRAPAEGDRRGAAEHHVDLRDPHGDRVHVLPVHLQGAADARTGRVTVVAAIDNLGKGAAGQAIQNANLMLGLPETAGLSAIGVAP